MRDGSGGPLGAATSLSWTLQRLRTLLPPRLDLLAALLLAALLEVYGRHSTADWIDAIGALVLVDLGRLFLARWPGARRRVRRVTARVRALWTSLRTPHGLDLRGEPPLPTGVPRRPLLAIAAVFALLAVVSLAAAHVPTDVRTFLQGVSGLALLATTGALWALLGAVAVGLWGTIFEGLRRAVSPAVAQGAGLLALALVALVSWRAPIGLGLAVLALGWASGCLPLAWLARDVRLAWRDVDGTVRSGRLGAWESLLMTAMVALALVPVLLATGDRLVDGAHDSTAGTALLGRFVLWSLGGTTLAFALFRILPLHGARRADPRRPHRPRLELRGNGDLSAARARLAAAGYPCSAPRGRSDVVVPLEIVAPHADAPVPATGSPWTGRATIADLGRPGFLARLARRHRVQARRALRKGLVRVLGRLRAGEDAPGTGTWIAPHLWIATHPTRDGVDPDVLPRGPSWRRLLPQAARAALAETLRAIDVDLLFVEDGVRPRSFARVLDLCFEHHDLFGTRRCEDARHFAGIPGVRVVLHEIGLEVALDAGLRGYPEPDTRDLGRARILHVFRDRGGERERAFAPSDRDRLPRLVPLG